MGLYWCRAGIGEACLLPVADRSNETFLAIIKACIFPSTTIVSDCGDVQRSSQQWGLAHRAVKRCVIFMDSLSFPHAITIEVTWENVKVHLRIYWENKGKCVINELKCSLWAGFDIVPELVVQCCVQFITSPLVHIIHLSCLSGYFPNILKIAEIQPIFKKADEQFMKNFRSTSILPVFFFPKYWRRV